MAIPTRTDPHTDPHTNTDTDLHSTSSTSWRCRTSRQAAVVPREARRRLMGLWVLAGAHCAAPESHGRAGSKRGAAAADRSRTDAKDVMPSTIDGTDALHAQS
eukprot:2747253-Rhodomonas_salina.1